jgi:hypothetical protein
MLTWTVWRLLLNPGRTNTAYKKIISLFHRNPRKTVDNSPKTVDNLYELWINRTIIPRIHALNLDKILINREESASINFVSRISACF